MAKLMSAALLLQRRRRVICRRDQSDLNSSRRRAGRDLFTIPRYEEEEQLDCLFIRSFDPRE